MEIDQIFVGIHIRVLRLVSSLVPPSVRSLVVASNVLLSIFLLTSLIALHHQHIHPHGTHYRISAADWEEGERGGGGGGAGNGAGGGAAEDSFPSLVHFMERSDVVRVQIVPPCPRYDPLSMRGWSCWWTPQADIRLQRLGDRKAAVENEQRHSSSAPSTAASGEARAVAVELGPAGATEDGLAALTANASTSSRSSAVLRPPVAVPPNFSSSPALPGLALTSPSRPTSTPSPSEPPPTSPSLSTPSRSPAASFTFEYAHHKGYFLLPTSLYSRHAIVTTVVSLAASHPSFGPFPLSLLTYHLFGYDSIVLNHLIRQRHVGYMRNVDTRDISTLAGEEDKQQQQQHTAHSSPPATAGSSLAWLLSSRALHLVSLLLFKAELLVTTLFLFFATTTLVSSTLTQTQLRMLHFTDQLRQHLRLHLPIVGLVLEHTMQSLSFVPVVVGILFFLFEFFHDQLLAFLLLLTVWLCESYTVLFTRTSTSMLYFPKLFALYFLMFAVYFFSFPYGFHYIAIALTASQLCTCMAYYLFAYEIPAVEEGRISIHRPRMLVLRRSEGDAQQRARTGAPPAAMTGGGGARSGVAEAEARGGLSSASAAASGGHAAPVSGSSAASGRSRDGGELLGRLLGLWEDRPRPSAEGVDGAASSGQRRRGSVGEDGLQAEDGEGEDALQFSRRELRRAPPPAPSRAVAPSRSPTLPSPRLQLRAAGEAVQSDALARAASSPSSHPSRPAAVPLSQQPASPPSSASSSLLTASSTPHFTLSSFIQPPPSSSSSFSSTLSSPPASPFLPLPPPPSSPSSAPPDSSALSSNSARLLLITPSPSSARSSSSPAPSSSSNSFTIEPWSHPPQPASSDALQHLASLPPLLQSLLKAVQGWTSSSSTVLSHRPSPRRSRALSSQSPSAHTAFPKEVAVTEGLSPSPRSRRASNPHPPHSPVASVSPASLTVPLPPPLEAKEEVSSSSSVPIFSSSLQPPPASSPPPPSTPQDSAQLHRAVLEQLAHVLQVALFVLTTLHLVQPPHDAALPTHTTHSVYFPPSAVAAPLSDEPVWSPTLLSPSRPPSLIDHHSLSAPSRSPSPVSPRPPHSPLRAHLSPRSSPRRGSPSSSSTRAASSRPSTSPSPAARSLFTSRAQPPHSLPPPLPSLEHAVGSGEASLTRLGAAGAAASSTVMPSEPTSPTDAPMM